jgi:hypothetical protein
MTKRTLIISLFSLVVLLACKKPTVENPYTDLPRDTTSNTAPTAALEEGNFAWLHEKIFKPTCANSGCHDGTFEPEFRTIGAAYNSLVNEPVIANNSSNSFVHRVVPGNAAQSWLHERMTTFVENTSGIMPLTTEPTSDWPVKREFYIQKVTEWINAGAPDMYGNPAPPAQANMPPQVYGLAIFPHGSTTNPYPRNPNSIYGIGEIMVPAAQVDVWILPYDDNAGVNQFNNVGIKVSDSVSDFSSSPLVPFSLQTPISANDFGNNPNQFYYMGTLDLSGATPGNIKFVRTYLNDGVQPSVTEIPNSSSAYFWYLLFSLKIV